MKLDKVNRRRLIALITFLTCFSMIWWPGQDEMKALMQSGIMICWFYLGFISRRPHPKEKTLLQRFRIVWLKVRIFILEMYLSRYPDLKIYRGNPRVKEDVWQHRDKLKELKAELKQLVK